MKIETLKRLQGYIKIFGLTWLLAFIVIMAGVVMDVRGSPEKYHLIEDGDGNVLTEDQLKRIDEQRVPSWSGTNFSFGEGTGGLDFKLGGYPDWVYDTNELIFYKNFYHLVMGKLGFLFLYLLLLLGLSNKVNALMAEALEERDGSRAVVKEVEKAGNAL